MWPNISTISLFFSDGDSELIKKFKDKTCFQKDGLQYWQFSPKEPSVQSHSPVDILQMPSLQYGGHTMYKKYSRKTENFKGH